VETQQQVETLTQMSCDQAQGYFYSRPLRPTDLELFIFQSQQEFSIAGSTTIVNQISQTAIASLA
jgi:sensor c-di-GMP phosphodiesterase-like protein